MITLTYTLHYSAHTPTVQDFMGALAHYDHEFTFTYQGGYRMTQVYISSRDPDKTATHAVLIKLLTGRE